MKNIICLLVVALCGIVLASQQGKWVLQAQTNFKHNGVDSYQFCVPVGVRTKTDKTFVSMQVVFEETFRYMSVDFDFNGKGWDHIENTETGIATFILSDYQGNTYSQWHNSALGNGTVTGTIKSDKKPIKIIFSIAVNKEADLEVVPRAVEKCERFYAVHEVVTTTTEVDPVRQSVRVRAGMMFFICSALGTFFLTLSCCACCYLVAKRRACKRACRKTSAAEMEGLYPGELSHIQHEQETRQQEPVAMQVPQPIYYIAPQGQDGQTPYWMPPQFVPMMHPQYMQFVPNPQDQQQ